MMGDQSGKVAIVTGSNTGIGFHMARALASKGAMVIMACRDLEKTGVAMRRIQDEFPDSEVSTSELDLADLSSVQSFSEGFSSGAERLDILINNAGVITRSDAVEATKADWDTVMDVNPKSLFFTTPAFGKDCFAKGRLGCVINIASMLSFQGGIRVAAYTASKHGVAGLTKTLANEWAAKGVNMNAIAPGYITTKNTAALRIDTARNAAIIDRIPAGSWGQPEDISGAAVYLCTPAARYVHGTILNVDGGWLAG